MSAATVPGPADGLLDALLRADAVDASEVVEEALEGGLDPIAILDDVVTPAMHAVGRRWQTGTIGIAEEHVASSVVARLLTRLAPLLITAPARSRPPALLAAAQGERHVLGLQMAGDVLEGAGYAVKFAGADLPAQALLSYAERERPALVAIGCTGSWAPAADIRNAITQLVAARPDIGVVLGGAGWIGFKPPRDTVVLVENMRGLLPEAARLTVAA